MATEECHVMVFPWLAFGHMLPFLELSKKLAANGIRISFVSTPRNLERLPSIPAHLSDLIKLVEIILPTVDGLPDNCEATVDIQQHETQYLKKAYDNLQAPFEKLLENDTAQLILIDFSPYWVPEVAAKFGVSTAFFSVYTAATLAYMGPPDELRWGHRRTTPEAFTVAPDWFTFHSLVSHRPDYAPTMLRNLHIPDESGKSSGQRISTIIEGCQFVAIRSCKEFEGEYIDLLQELYKKPVLPVGIFPPERTTEKAVDSSWSSTFKWLDRKRPKSVLFVGFGSEYKMPIEQVHELAHGLELSGISFIWILRKPKGVDSLDLLPSNFESRVFDKGVVCLGWAPQIDILAHPSIGGCLFHSGWGSIIESLGFGHPLILMPMVADQGLNAKLLDEKGLGYEVPRNEDGSFTRDMVAESVKLVMGSQGEPIREKASQMQSTFCDHTLQKNYISSFVHYLQRFKRTESTLHE
ncbi:putative UDP-rhamnose:rhamnosyltransferase 1 [Cynara cardunculus var. scolymus]|uniref:putative UDP-rhamnose:rhamnosyltransferase 1 n=1 Tax=Cynara cardunculus var. scolymus TaxID=59895 RepID=UPI000D6232B7|nr:putative UDP-rhamnose:rhamnosyltransferase 1 [Cynara cardunculus var. scolymus]